MVCDSTSDSITPFTWNKNFFHCALTINIISLCARFYIHTNFFLLLLHATDLRQNGNCGSHDKTFCTLFKISCSSTATLLHFFTQYVTCYGICLTLLPSYTNSFSLVYVRLWLCHTGTDDYNKHTHKMIIIIIIWDASMHMGISSMDSYCSANVYK